MAKKKNAKVSFNAIDNVLKENDVSPVDAQVAIGDEVLKFNVKRILDPVSFGAMVTSTVAPLFDITENGFEEYRPELKKMVMVDAMMIFVANFKPETKMEQVVSLMYATDIVDIICGIWSEKQRKDYEVAVDEAINSRINSIASSERAKLVSISQQLEAATSILTQITETFEGMEKSTIQDAVQNMANASGEEIISAVANARRSNLKVVE